MTYAEILRRAEALGNNMADVALGDMMDTVEEETGRFPDWNDFAPAWICRNFGF